MPRYAITERAGPFVAAHRNAGVGTVLELSERQAEHELRLGTLVPLPQPDERAATEPRATVAEALPGSSIAPTSGLENDAPALSRRQKRSAT